MRVIASQKLCRDNGEIFFAARHQDALADHAESLSSVMPFRSSHQPNNPCCQNTDVFHLCLGCSNYWRGDACSGGAFFNLCLKLGMQSFEKSLVQEMSNRSP